MERPQTVYPDTLTATMRAHIPHLIQGAPAPLEERVAALERQRDAVRDDPDTRETRVTKTVQRRLDKRIELTTRRVQDVHQQLEGYILDDRRLLRSRIFIGPALLGLGLILGASGNVLSLWT